MIRLGGLYTYTSHHYFALSQSKTAQLTIQQAELMQMVKNGELKCSLSLLQDRKSVRGYF